MSYSKQSCNGTTVENIDGKIFVNGVEVIDGKLQKMQPIHFITLTLFTGFGVLCGFIGGILYTMSHI